MRRKGERQDWRDVVRADCAMALLPAPSRDWPIHPPDTIRVPLAWPKYRVAVALATGATRKLSNQAAMFGWRVLRYTPSQVMRGLVRRDIQDIISRDGVARANERIAAGLPTLPGRRRTLRPTVGRQAHMDQSATVGPQVVEES